MSDNQFVKTSLCAVVTVVSAWAVVSGATFESLREALQEGNLPG